MKKLYFILLSVIVLCSCQGKKNNGSLESVLSSNNLKKIRAKKTEIDQKQKELAQQMELINNKISQLDTVKKIPLVTTFAAKEAKFKHYLELQGNVQTKQNVLIYPEVPGQLISVYVKEGQQVTKGQALAKIDDGGLSQQVSRLQAQAQLAKTTYERQKRLWKQKIGSEIQFLQAKTNYQAQSDAVKQLEKQLEKTTIRAPFNGVIDDVIKHQGTVVSPGPASQIFRIINLNAMYIETEVPESYVSKITRGAKVVVEFPVLGKTVESTIDQVSSFINPENRTFKVKINVPNKDKSIKPNLTAKLKINDYTNDKAVLVPQNVLSDNSKNQKYLYLVEGIKNNIGKAKKLIVKTGKTQGEFVEVLEGIKKDMHVIQEGARNVRDNQEVKILKSK